MMILIRNERACHLSDYSVGYFVKSDEIVRGRGNDVSGPLPFPNERRVQDGGETGDLGGFGYGMLGKVLRAVN